MAELAWSQEAHLGNGFIGYWSFADFTGGIESPWIDMGGPCVVEISILATRQATMTGGELRVEVENPGTIVTSPVPFMTRTSGAQDTWVFNDGGTTLAVPGGTSGSAKLVPLPTGRVRITSESGTTQGSVTFFSMGVRKV